MMTLFEQILGSIGLLNEAVDGRSLTQAIEKMLPVRLVYHDGVDERDKNGRLTYHGKRARTIYPFVYGKLKSGADAIAAYENYGSSRRGYDEPTNDKAVRDHGKSFRRNKPYWKLFRTDRIVSWSISKNSFKNRAEEFISKGLNVDGDDRFDEIYSISPMCSGYTGTKEEKPESQAPQITSKPNDITRSTQTQPIGPNPITKSEVQPEIQKTDWANQYNKEKDKGITLDNSGKISYNINKNNNKIEAPETKPIAKTDVSTEPVQKTGKDNVKPADDKPITKTEVDNGEKEKVENDITPKFNDMMNRWDKLNQEEEV